MDEYPKKGGSHSGTATGYSVEVKCDMGVKKITDDFILSKDWKTLPIIFGEMFGVPIGGLHSDELMKYQLFNYQSAQALRWAFHAYLEADWKRSDLCVQTRLVKHKVKFSSECEAIGHTETMGNSDDLDRSKGTAFPAEMEATQAKETP